MRSIALLLLLVASVGHADPHRLRMGTQVPDGTAWARELKAFARDAQAETKGELEIKWYLSGIAGDELEMAERIRRNQLDGGAFGGMLCQRLSPTMHVMRLPGLFESGDEAAYVLSVLTPAITEEFAKAGFVFLPGPFMGTDLLFTRRPVRTFEELRKITLWRWGLDETANAAANAMGMTTRPAGVNQAGIDYDEGRNDGFDAIPSAALAFQWSTQARYVTTLDMSYMQACVLVATRAMDTLSIEQQRILRAAAAKGIARASDVSRQTEAQLINGLLARQGVIVEQPSAALRRDFFAAARESWKKIGSTIVAPALLEQVKTLLAAYRAEHPNRAH